MVNQNFSLASQTQSLALFLTLTVISQIVHKLSIMIQLGPPLPSLPLPPPLHIPSDSLQVGPEEGSDGRVDGL